MTAAKARSGVRWLIIGMIAIATIVNYIDRNAMAVMWPEISKEIGASKEDYALLVSVFMIFYAIGQFGFGRLFDIIGTRVGFAVSILGWSISIALHAVATTVTQFAIFRAMLGITEAGPWPGTVKANAEWFPARERAFAQGIFNSGAALGLIISPPLIAWLFDKLHWQATFLLIGGLGALWVLPWLFVNRATPDKHPWVSESERALIQDRPDEVSAEPPPAPAYAPRLGQLLGHRSAWGVILARFFLDPVWWLFVSWLPLYLADTFGFDIKQIGAFGWVPFVGAMLGSLSGGWLSGALMRTGMSVGSARKLVITLGGLIMAPCLVLAPQQTDPGQAVLIIAGVLFGFQVAINNIQTLPSDLFSGKSVGTLAGVSGMAAVLGTLITTWLVPVMTKVSYTPIFLLVAALVPLSLASVWFVVGRVAPVEPRQPLVS